MLFGTHRLTREYTRAVTTVSVTLNPGRLAGTLRMNYSENRTIPLLEDQGEPGAQSPREPQSGASHEVLSSHPST